MIPTYPSIIKRVEEVGRRVPSRYGDTYELLGQNVFFDVGEFPVRPNVNWALGFMELLQILEGEFDLAALKRVAPRSNHSLFTYDMAYGPRLYTQIPLVLAELERNADTRQANLLVAGPKDGPTSSQPCTTHIQFIIRDGKLHTQVGMRSWDLLKGLTYDLVMFGGLALTIASILEVRHGPCQVHAGSAHVYDADLDKRPMQSQSRYYRFARELEDTWKKPELNAVARWEIVRQWAATQVNNQSWVKGFPPGLIEDPDSFLI